MATGRRNFLQKLGLGTTALGLTQPFSSSQQENKKEHEMNQILFNLGRTYAV